MREPLGASSRQMEEIRVRRVCGLRVSPAFLAKAKAFRDKSMADMFCLHGEQREVSGVITVDDTGNLKDIVEQDRCHSNNRFRPAESCRLTEHF